MRSLRISESRKKKLRDATGTSAVEKGAGKANVRVPRGDRPRFRASPVFAVGAALQLRGDSTLGVLNQGVARRAARPLLRGPRTAERARPLRVRSRVKCPRAMLPSSAAIGRQRGGRQTGRTESRAAFRSWQFPPRPHPTPGEKGTRGQSADCAVRNENRLDHRDPSVRPPQGRLQREGRCRSRLSIALREGPKIAVSRRDVRSFAQTEP